MAPFDKDQSCGPDRPHKGLKVKKELIGKSNRTPGNTLVLSLIRNKPTPKDEGISGKQTAIGALQSVPSGQKFSSESKGRT